MSWLRLPDFEASNPELVHDDAGNLIEVLVEARPKRDAFDVCCLAQKLVKNGTKAVRYRDRRIDPAPTWLVVKRQRVKCRSCGATLYQAVPHVDDAHYITERLKEDIVLSAINRPFRDAVRFHAVEETLVRRVFRSYADERLLKYRYKAPRVIGVDENHLLGSARFVVCDAENGLLFDMLEGRTQSDIRRGLERMEDWDNVEVWCQDMAGSYKGIARDLFPQARIVIDKFHVVQKANHIWDAIRRAETKNLPKEVRERIPGLMKLFLKHWDDLDRRTQDRIADVLAHNERMKTAYTLKEWFYFFYDAPTRADAEEAYRQWVGEAKAKQWTEWKPLMGMMQRWRSEIFNYFDHRYTSGMVERLNRSIGDINRASNGMDFQTLRAKAILRYSHLIPEERFNMFFVEFSLEDDPDDGTVLVGAGVDASTLAADLEAGLF